MRQALLDSAAGDEHPASPAHKQGLGVQYEQDLRMYSESHRASKKGLLHPGTAQHKLRARILMLLTAAVSPLTFLVCLVFLQQRRDVPVQVLCMHREHK